MADSVIGSKEMATIIITFALSIYKLYMNQEFPVDAAAILAAGLALTGFIRVFLTQNKITSFLPKGGT
jgi:hypothetical protein